MANRNSRGLVGWGVAGSDHSSSKVRAVPDGQCPDRGGVLRRLGPVRGGLRAAVQSRIDAKHEKRQLAGHDGEKWLVIVLGDTEAYWQFIHPPENIDGHWLLAALPYSLILTIEASTRCG